MSGVTVLRRDQVLMTLRSPAAFMASTFSARWSSMNGPFFRLRGIYMAPSLRRPWLRCIRTAALPPCAARTTPADDELVARLALLAGTPFGLAPGRHGVPTAGALALAAAKRVVDGVHRDAAGVRTLAFPTVTSGLTDRDQARLAVANGADGCPAVDRDAPHLG